MADLKFGHSIRRRIGVDLKVGRDGEVQGRPASEGGPYRAIFDCKFRGAV